MRGFNWGLKSYFSGLSYWTKSPSLLRLSVIPLILNFIFLVSGFVFSLNYLPNIIKRVISPPEFWYQYAFYYFVVLLSALSLFLIVFFLTFIVGNLIAFPFNSIIAEKALKTHPALAETKSMGFKVTMTNFIAMMRRTLFFLIIGLLLGLAALIPGLGMVGAGVGIFLMTYDRLDYGFDHYGLTFNERMGFIKIHFREIFGFMVGFGLTTTIPVINILIQPGSVVAGALLVAKLNRRDSSLERNHSQTTGRAPTKS